MDRTEDEVIKGLSFGESEAITMIIFFGVGGFFLLNSLYIATRTAGFLIPGVVWVGASLVFGIFSVFRFPEQRWLNFSITSTIHTVGLGVTLLVFTFILQ